MAAETAHKTSRLSVDIAPIMMAALEERATEAGMSKASIIRTALRVELRDEMRRASETRTNKEHQDCRHPG